MRAARRRRTELLPLAEEARPEPLPPLESPDDDREFPPPETEMAELYRDVSVAADEHLAATAGDLSLSELVALLGRRADGLADLWNEWGRVRPLLLEGA